MYERAAYRIDEENKMRDFWDRTAEAEKIYGIVFIEEC